MAAEANGTAAPPRTPVPATLAFVVQVCGSDQSLDVRVRRGARVKDVKDVLCGRLGVPSAQQHLYFRGTELPNKRSLWEAWVEEGSTVLLVVDDGTGDGGALASFDVRPCMAVRARYRRLPRLINQCRLALARGVKPKLAEDGEGGTYFMPGPGRGWRNKYVLCFKPNDEEPFGPQNPKTFVGKLGQRGLREGIVAGEAYLRECAAYCLDKDNFSGVPETMICEARHPSFNYPPQSSGGEESKQPALPMKTGSLQEFVRFDDIAGNYAPKKFPVREVHKIGVLDIRLLNLDRNDANILVKMEHTDPPPGVRWEDHEPEVKLIPIDHGYCLPSTLNVGWCDWVWYEWPQAKEPFDAETLAYIAALDPDADARMLRDGFSIREECINTVRITGLLLKKGAAAGMTLYDIASIILRSDLDSPSKLENVVDQAFTMVEYHAHNHRLRGTPRVGKKHSFAPSHKRDRPSAPLTKSYSTGTPASDGDAAAPTSPTSASVGVVATHADDSGTSGSVATSVTATSGSGVGSGSSASPSPSPSPPLVTHHQASAGGQLDATATAPAQGLRDWIRAKEGRGAAGGGAATAGNPPLFVPRIPAPLHSTRSCYSVPSVHSAGPRTPVSPGRLPAVDVSGTVPATTPPRRAGGHAKHASTPGSDDAGGQVQVDEALGAAASTLVEVDAADAEAQVVIGQATAPACTGDISDDDEAMGNGASGMDVEVVHSLHDGDFGFEAAATGGGSAAPAATVAATTPAVVTTTATPSGVVSAGGRGKYIIPAKRRAMQRAAEAAAAATAAGNQGIASLTNPRKPAALVLGSPDASARRQGVALHLPPRSPASLSPAPDSPGRRGGVFFATPAGGGTLNPRAQSPLSPGAAVRPPPLPLLATRGAVTASGAPPPPQVVALVRAAIEHDAVAAAPLSAGVTTSDATTAAGVALSRPVVRVSNPGGDGGTNDALCGSPGAATGVSLSPTKRARVALSPATLTAQGAASDASGATSPSPRPPSGSPPPPPHRHATQQGGATSPSAAFFRGVVPARDAAMDVTSGRAYSNSAWLAAAAAARTPAPSLTRVASYCAGTGFMGGYSPGRGGRTTSAKLLQALVHGGGRASFPLDAPTTGSGSGGGGASTGSASGAVDAPPRRRGGSPKAHGRSRRHRAFHLTWARSHADAVHLVQQFMGYFAARLDAEVDVWRSMRRIRSKVLRKPASGLAARHGGEAELDG